MTNDQPSYRDRIVTDPAILVGKPTVRGTRIPVALVLKRLSQDFDLNTLFESYPRLTEEDVKACLGYAGDVLERRRPRRKHAPEPATSAMSA